jgi:hypothetical protein
LNNGRRDHGLHFGAIGWRGQHMAAHAARLPTLILRCSIRDINSAPTSHGGPQGFKVCIATILAPRDISTYIMVMQADLAWLLAGAPFAAGHVAVCPLHCTSCAPTGALRQRDVSDERHVACNSALAGAQG